MRAASAASASRSADVHPLFGGDQRAGTGADGRLVERRIELALHQAMDDRPHEPAGNDAGAARPARSRGWPAIGARSRDYPASDHRESHRVECGPGARRRRLAVAVLFARRAADSKRKAPSWLVQSTDLAIGFRRRASEGLGQRPRQQAARLRAPSRRR